MAVAMPLRVTCVTGGSIASVGQVYLFFKSRYLGYHNHG